MAIAIDFGTSNTVITRINPTTNEGEIVKLPAIAQRNPQIPPVVPSLLYVQDAKKEQVIIGQTVRDKGLDVITDSRYFRNFKRGISINTPVFLPNIDERTVSFEEIGEWFLSQIIPELGKEKESLILTVPVDSFESYRYWLNGVCQKWDIPQVRIIDEPTAAALGYGTEHDKYILVVDFGGGTIDFSLVELDMGKSQQAQGFILKWGEKLFGENSAQKTKLAKVMGKAGANLGGCDLDNWILDYFHTQQGVEKSALTTRLAERVKYNFPVRRKHKRYFLMILI